MRGILNACLKTNLHYLYKYITEDPELESNNLLFCSIAVFACEISSVQCCRETVLKRKGKCP